MSRLIDNIKRLAEIVKNETKSGANTAVRIGGLFGEIAAELERKYDKTESDEQMREHDTNAEAHQNIQDRIDGVLGGLSNDKLDKTGDGKDVVVSFQEATDRVNVETGDSLSVLAGKVRKWFAGLQTVAFSGKTEDLVSDADHRLVTDTEKARWNDTYTRQETDNKDSAVLDTAKKYVMDRISDVISGSPAALDTLYEIANALNNDPNFATTIMALINGKADTGHKHTKAQISDFPTSMPASDVYAWAKQPNKPSYSAGEVGAAAANHNHDTAYQPKGNYAPANHTHDYAAKSHKHAATDITQDSTHRFMTDLERSKLAGLEQGGLRVKIVTINTNLDGNFNCIFGMNTNEITITLPPPQTNMYILIRKCNTGAIVVKSSSGSYPIYDDTSPDASHKLTTNGIIMLFIYNHTHTRWHKNIISMG